MLQLRFASATKAPIWLVASKYRFGTNNDNDCVLTQDGIFPLHAEIVVDGEVVTLIRKCDGGVISVNGIPLEREKRVFNGDQIVFGEVSIAIVDPKQESPLNRLQNNENTQLRSALIPEVAVQAATWHLRPLNTTLIPGTGFELIGSLLIGRSKECDICIPASHLSRKHAKFSVVAGSLSVEDLGSSNGTFVNGKKRDRIVLKHGDEVSFDTLKFRVESSQNLDEATTLRAALGETQVRQALTPEQILRANQASARKAPPVRPKSLNQPSLSANPNTSSGTKDSIVVIAGLLAVVAAIAAITWYLLV